MKGKKCGLFCQNCFEEERPDKDFTITEFMTHCADHFIKKCPKKGDIFPLICRDCGKSFVIFDRTFTCTAKTRHNLQVQKFDENDHADFLKFCNKNTLECSEDGCKRDKIASLGTVDPLSDSARLLQDPQPRERARQRQSVARSKSPSMHSMTTRSRSREKSVASRLSMSPRYVFSSSEESEQETSTKKKTSEKGSKPRGRPPRSSRTPEPTTSAKGRKTNAEEDTGAKKPSAEKPEAKKPGAKRSESKEPETKRPGARRSESKEPETKRPGARRAESKEPEAKRPGARRAESKEPEAKRPGARRSESKEPETKRPGARRAESKEPEAKRPGARRAESKEPEAKRPGARRAESKEPETQEVVPPTPPAPSRGRPLARRSNAFSAQDKAVPCRPGPSNFKECQIGGDPTDFIKVEPETSEPVLPKKKNAPFASKEPAQRSMSSQRSAPRTPERNFSGSSATKNQRAEPKTPSRAVTPLRTGGPNARGHVRKTPTRQRFATPNRKAARSKSRGSPPASRVVPDNFFPRLGKSCERSGVSYKTAPNAFRSRSKSPSVNPVPQFSRNSFGGNKTPTDRSSTVRRPPPSQKMKYLIQDGADLRPPAKSPNKSFNYHGSRAGSASPNRYPCSPSEHWNDARSPGEPSAGPSSADKRRHPGYSDEGSAAKKARDDTMDDLLDLQNRQKAIKASLEVRDREKIRKEEELLAKCTAQQVSITEQVKETMERQKAAPKPAAPASTAHTLFENWITTSSHEPRVAAGSSKNSESTPVPPSRSANVQRPQPPTKDDRQKEKSSFSRANVVARAPRAPAPAQTQPPSASAAEGQKNSSNVAELIAANPDPQPQPGRERKPNDSHQPPPDKNHQLPSQTTAASQNSGVVAIPRNPHQMLMPQPNWPNQPYHQSMPQAMQQEYPNYSSYTPPGLMPVPPPLPQYIPLPPSRPPPEQIPVPQPVPRPQLTYEGTPNRQRQQSGDSLNRACEGPSSSRVFAVPPPPVLPNRESHFSSPPNSNIHEDRGPSDRNYSGQSRSSALPTASTTNFRDNKGHDNSSNLPSRDPERRQRK
ncbi:unnamed protein product [Caenorhabditis auriculariae]|uniref:Uncharacterized protein n=1 Tax=Caenorhabditis auriculariae TaxID=2777116 RepID=A0A8S1GUP6_9PELO|nr:unnamed protein product [Caenorhabditis auriculariae]